MSDLPGLAAALVAQVLILQGRKDRHRLVYGALASGVAAGIRLQTAWLTVPLLVLSLVAQRAAGVRWLLTRPVAAFAAGGLAWGVPLVVDSGGVAGYLARAWVLRRGKTSPGSTCCGWTRRRAVSPSRCTKRSCCPGARTSSLPRLPLPR